ncbi:MAG: Glycerol-3-phosphate dehydrogenase [NAD(P)+] [Chlamydiales bacterium]|nr:Glycerol-3-phosphate dehydrogenase [NAD(P)+] [Chlamydiales bacterium]MCH9619457.1 Glycerol-3-phosphate dehydrogenase [NAD(P)+] [Chlamydiales bacterium]MCH9622261.1 Glycerol-3-phosphate dehydrogenase [NAD(P)+] [Chlamydiales bacterium]
MKLKIGYLGTGVWGYTLAHLLASKGYEVTSWGIEEGVIAHLNEKRQHPKLPDHSAHPTHHFTTDLKEALSGKDLIVEGVTSAGVRQVLQNVKETYLPKCPIVLTSKGIEQNTGLLLSEVAVEVLGEKCRKQIGCISGPSIAPEVLGGLPATVVCSAYSSDVMKKIHTAFSTPTFRVYPNPDINGVELGGALKNIIAIACGISDGLGFGDNTKAALMTRGLHEIRRLAETHGCKAETLNGLAGMGDLCVTCLSTMSRNYRFGRLIAKGKTPDEAKKEIGMVVEGTYSCLSALQLAKKEKIELPISEVVYKIVYEGLNPKEAVKLLLQRSTKEEYL